MQLGKFPTVVPCPVSEMADLCRQDDDDDCDEEESERAGATAEMAAGNIELTRDRPAKPMARKGDGRTDGRAQTVGHPEGGALEVW